MQKPNDLKRILLASIPQLKHDPERVLVFVERGRIRCTAAASLSFEYAYDLRIIITSFAGSSDLIMLPILGWARQHQSELLANLDNAMQAIQFEAEILDNDSADISISLPLTERVVAKRLADGTYDLQHAPDPGYTAYEDSGPLQFIVNGEVLAQWQPPPAPDGVALATPHPKPRGHE
ncbi:phage tail protein [Pseudomonas sp. C9-3]|uniref:phage tail protein n=1 Tax=Pseudomonas sp. C9-3 TaxID=3078264 RepID=UPI0028F1681C|nr:phage tail protein [Pseudomonas sp. C9-3]